MAVNRKLNKMCSHRSKKCLKTVLQRSLAVSSEIWKKVSWTAQFYVLHREEREKQKRQQRMKMDEKMEHIYRNDIVKYH